MENKQVFQDILSDYEAARPGYPDELFCDIIEYAGLPASAHLLEIGAGPGQATEYFARNNYDLTALEISEKQVSFLNEKFANQDNFRSVCATFEEFPGEDSSYELIFSATAFHWISPDIGYPKAFRLLKKTVLSRYSGTLLPLWSRRRSCCKASARSTASMRRNWTTT